MCPNHVEHFLDSNLVSSTSVTERLKIWQKFARTPLNPDSVRLEFFRKVRTGKLFRSGRNAKLPKPNENRIKVPGYVKTHYRNRIEPFPIEHSEALLGPTRQLGSEAIASASASDLGSRQMSADEKEWLMNIISLQTCVLKIGNAAATDADAKPAPKTKAKRRRARARVRPNVIKNEAAMTNGDADAATHSDADASSDAESVSTASECSLGLEEDDNEFLSTSTQDELREYLARHQKSGDLDAVDQNVLKFLAAKQLSELFPKPIQVNADAEVRARAALVPLYQNSRAQPCLMRYRTLEVGIGGKTGLDLSSFSHQCNYVSKRLVLNCFWLSGLKSSEVIRGLCSGIRIQNLRATLVHSKTFSISSIILTWLLM